MERKDLRAILSQFDGSLNDLFSILNKYEITPQDLKNFLESSIGDQEWTVDKDFRARLLNWDRTQFKHIENILEELIKPSSFNRPSNYEERTVLETGDLEEKIKKSLEEKSNKILAFRIYLGTPEVILAESGNFEIFDMTLELIHQLICNTPLINIRYIPLAGGLYVISRGYSSYNCTAIFWETTPIDTAIALVDYILIKFEEEINEKSSFSNFYRKGLISEDLFT